LPDNAAENIFIEFNERYFANLLYFVLFGPLGPFVVLLYNFTAIARLNHSELVKVHAILAWLPARLASFSFALVGNFAPVTRTWLSAVANVQVSSSKILTDCGQASVDVDEKQVAERSLVAWAILCIIVVIMK
jgi:membrane protein required for beta-lactamase induction